MWQALALGSVRQQEAARLGMVQGWTLNKMSDTCTAAIKSSYGKLLVYTYVTFVNNLDIVLLDRNN